jgi:hypothetical protein
VPKLLDGFLPSIALLVVLMPSIAPAGEARLVGPFAKDEYPQAVIDRPLTLPAGMVEAEVGGRFRSIRFDTPIFGVGGADDWDIDFGVRLGVTDRIQVEAGTAFSLAHTERDVGNFQGGPTIDFRPSLISWSRIVPFRISLLAVDTSALDTAVTLTLPFVAHPSSSRKVALTRFGTAVVRDDFDGRVLPVIQLAAPTRWRLTDWFWFRAGENLFGVTTADGVAAFQFDFGVGVQPHRLCAVTLDSRIATIVFDGDGERASQTIGDFGTIDLEGVFAPTRWFDLVGSLGLPDVGKAFDDYLTRAAVRVRF